jgi:hypothetical protein
MNCLPNQCRERASQKHPRDAPDKWAGGICFWPDIYRCTGQADKASVAGARKDRNSKEPNNPKQNP